jgi:hypothetical protein
VLLGHDEHGEPIELTFDHFYRHMHFLGLSRRGKSRALVHVLRQFLLNRTGFTLIDPDGEIYGPLVEWLSTQDERFLKDRTIHLFNPADHEFSPSYNPLRVRPGELIEDRVNCFMDAVAQMNQGEPLAIMQLYQMIFRAVMSPLAQKGLTPLEALLVLPQEEEALRAFLIRDLRNWVDEQTWKAINGWTPRLYEEKIGSTIQRMSNLVHHSSIQRVFGQTENNLDVLEVMDQGQVLLVNLQGVDTQVANFIGRTLVNDYVQTARKWRVPGEARPHIMVIDECAPFLSEDIVTGLDRTSKVGLHFVLSHQRIGQLVKQGNENIRDGVIAGAQTKIYYAINYETATLLVDDTYGTYYNTERLKENVTQPMVTGFKPVIHRGGSTGTAEHQARTETVSDAIAKSRTETEQQVQGVAHGQTTSETEARGETSGHSLARAAGGGTATTKSRTESEGSSEAESVGRSELSSYGSTSLESDTITSVETAAAGTSTAMGYQDPGMILPSMPDSLTITDNQSQGSAEGTGHTMVEGFTQTEAYGTSETSTRGRTKTTALGEAETQSRSWQEVVAENRGQSLERSRSAAKSYVENRSQSRGLSEGETATHSLATGLQQGTTAQTGASWQEAREPIIEERATQTHSLEEERHRYINMLVNQGVRQFTLKDPIGEPGKLVRTGTTVAVERLPVEPKELRAFTQKLYLSTGINTPIELVDQARNKRQLELRRAAGPTIIPPAKRPERALIESKAEETQEDDPNAWLE